MSKAVQQKLNLPVASQEKAEELAALLFQVEYFIAHLEPEDNRETVAVEVLQILGKLQDFRAGCPAMTDEAHDLFFKLYYFFSHLEPSEFETAAIEGLDILKDVHDVELLVMESETEAAAAAAPVPAPVAPAVPVVEVPKVPDPLEEAVAEAISELVQEAAAADAGAVPVPVVVEAGGVQ